MKKLVTFILAAMLMFSFAVAETVLVSISDDTGTLVLPAAEIEISDADSDGSITIYDALYSAHEASFEGGAAAGFSVENSDYGPALIKLWGVENGGSYGYYVNNVSAYSMIDPVKDGDHIKAFAYTDLDSWSDTYCYFDFLNIETSTDFELTLSAQSFDADWNPVLIPVEGAVITVNGEKTAFITDANGKVVVELEEPGEYVLSAVSDSMVLIPPVCIAKIG